MSFKDHFSAVAGKYAEFRPDYPRELFNWLSEAAGSRRTAWDCATGNGQAALGLAEFFDQVFATDASADQIRNAVPHPKIRYSVAPAEQSALPNSSVDLVTVAQAAHWFDLERFYAEAQRVLRPGGTVALWCYGLMRFDQPGIQVLMDEFYGKIVGPYWPPERRLIESGYRTLPFPFDEFSSPPFSIKAEFDRDRLLGYLRTWSATQRFIKDKGYDPVSTLDEKLEKEWRTSPRIEWPISMRIGRVR